MLSVGIIGLGVGEQHIAGYESHPGCKVTMLCDISHEKREMATAKYPRVKVVDDPHLVLRNPEIDVVSIASYDNYHHAQTMEALKHDKHVFVEKPLCLFDYEAKEIRSSLNEKPHLKMSSNFILRKSPRFIRLKDMIGEGTFGDLYYVEGDYNYGRIHKITDGWRGQIDFYSVMYGGGSHIVDLLLWLTGGEVEEVVAYGNGIATEGTKFRYNDMCVGLLKFKSGMIGKVSANFGCVFPHFHALTLYGKKASYINDFEYGKLYTSRESGTGFEKISDAYASVHKGRLIYEFIDSIANGSAGGVMINEVFKCMSVCFALEKSVSSANPVTVEYI
ncbi:MAG TPA: Gfo/Idh/MocA family oxidoreductase [Syntrophorhabdaceae bacterium]|nr:Gfo/Idh/MocA family oxidoreductase [Syntrophorhabdaceae bacterium]